MSVYAIIAEFNPFHNGHELLINRIKESDREAAIVAVMSGSFVERGDVAVVDKYCRAEAALKCGCNLVLELPAPWSFSGAEFFARGGVKIADSIGISDFLAFGSESGDINSLRLCAERLSANTFAAAVDTLRKEHPEYNTAKLRLKAYEKLYGKISHLNGSNDLLALEYLSAIRELSAKIEPMAVRRAGGDYNSAEMSKICSATAIRNAISDGTDFLGAVPYDAYYILKNQLDEGRIYRLKGLDTAISALLRTITPEELAGYMEISGGMENRLIKAADKHRTIEEIIKAAKQRRYSESRLRRAIISALVGVKMADAEALPLFTVLLGADSVGRSLLSALRKKTKITIMSKQSDEKKLTGEAAKQYALHKKAERLAELCCEGEPRRISAVML